MMESLVNRDQWAAAFPNSWKFKAEKEQSYGDTEMADEAAKITGSGPVPAELCWVEFHFGLFVGVIVPSVCLPDYTTCNCLMLPMLLQPI